MRSTRTNRFLLPILLLAVAASAVGAQPNQQDSVQAKRQLNAALNEGDAQKFAANVDLISPTERDEFLLYALSLSTKPSIEIIRVLLDKGANVNQPTRYKTALMHAAGEGHADIVQLLLARGAQVNTVTDEGTALMEAVKGGHTEIVKLLLASGADVKAVNRNNEPAISLAARQRNYRAPTVEPTAEIVQLLLAHGADANAANRSGETALMFANTAAMVKLLVAAGAQLETKDEEGRTALLKAALKGEADVANALIASGANVNATDNKGSNALLHALDRENLAYGDDRNTLPQRRLEVARTLLLAKSLDVNAQNGDGETALMRAVRLENVELIKALLARGADGNRSDVFGDTAATLAYASGRSELEQLLPAPQRFKHQPAKVLNAFLRAAIGRKDETKVKELLDAGADPNHEYAIGYMHKSVKERVLVVAAGLGHTGIVQLLLDKGADINAQGLISGSEHGLKYGTALEAAELSKKPEVVALLRKAVHD
jgi:ankyrin repeat protein